MIISIYIGSDEANTNYKKFKHGVNLTLRRVDSDGAVELGIEGDDGEEITSFFVPFSELKKAIEILSNPYL
jgi:hypothetical protein